MPFRKNWVITSARRGKRLCPPSSLRVELPRETLSTEGIAQGGGIDCPGLASFKKEMGASSRSSISEPLGGSD